MFIVLAEPIPVYCIIFAGGVCFETVLKDKVWSSGIKYYLLESRRRAQMFLIQLNGMLCYDVNLFKLNSYLAACHLYSNASAMLSRIRSC